MSLMSLIVWEGSSWAAQNLCKPGTSRTSGTSQTTRAFFEVFGCPQAMLWDDQGHQGQLEVFRSFGVHTGHALGRSGTSGTTRGFFEVLGCPQAMLWDIRDIKDNSRFFRCFGVPTSHALGRSGTSGTAGTTQCFSRFWSGHKPCSGTIRDIRDIRAQHFEGPTARTQPRNLQIHPRKLQIRLPDASNAMEAPCEPFARCILRDQKYASSESPRELRSTSGNFRFTSGSSRELKSTSPGVQIHVLEAPGTSDSRPGASDSLQGAPGSSNPPQGSYRTSLNRFRTLSVPPLDNLQ